MAIRFLELTALATAAVPGLVVVETADAPVPASGFDTALLRDREGRMLLASRPRSADAAREQLAELRSIGAMTDGVRSRLPFQVPRILGSAGEGPEQVAVSEYIPGSPPIDAELAPGSALLAELGEAIAAVHALPRDFAVAAGLPQRTATEAREAADELIERAKGTGRLPLTLERRWLAAIDDPTLWQYQPCVSHGGLDLDSFLSIDSRLEAVIDWSDLRIGDPARDLRWVTSLRPQAAAAIVDAYTAARGASVDRQLRQRASLYAELELARWLVHAVATDDPELIADAEHLLDELVGRVRTVESKPLVHETLPVLDIAEVRELLKDAQQVRERTAPEAARRAAAAPDESRGSELDAAEHDDLHDDVPESEFLRGLDAEDEAAQEREERERAEPAGPGSDAGEAATDAVVGPDGPGGPDELDDAAERRGAEGHDRA